MSSLVQKVANATRPKSTMVKFGLADPWAEALKTLSAEEQEQFGPSDTELLDVLVAVQKGTEENKTRCLENGWIIDHDKSGDAVKLRHILQKISVWVNAAIKVVDVGISYNRSGHAALPWEAIKYLITIGLQDVEIFTRVSEVVESASSLIARYTIFEKLYLSVDCESTPKLHQAICKLYAAILRYLSKARNHFDGNLLQHFGRNLRQAMTDQYKELQSQITEINLERWARLVDAELQKKSGSDMTDRYGSLKLMLHDLSQPIMQISDQVTRFKDTIDREDQRQLFRWLSRIEYKKHHEYLSKDVIANSGQWLLESQAYVKWGQSSESSTLLLHGFSGSGKTRLVSSVVNNMFKRYAHLSMPPIAYFYCVKSEAERERSMPVEIMKAILRQLSGTELDFPIREPIVNEYKTRKRKADLDGTNLSDLSVEDCTRLILELTDETPAIIIIDAIDECDNNLRYRLLGALNSIVEKSKNMVKVFVSSRDDVNIRLHFENCQDVSIGADQNSQDIERYVYSELDQRINRRVLLGGNVSPKLKTKMATELINSARGNFCWIAMSLEVLCNVPDKVDFFKALSKLPPQLSGLYDIVYNQINQTGTHGGAVATATLNWLLCSERLLVIEEFIAAVSGSVELITKQEPVFDIATLTSYGTSYGPSSFREIEFLLAADPEIGSISAADILRLTRNFVVFDSQAQTFRFAHQSVREHLLAKQIFLPEELHLLALETCLNAYTAAMPSKFGSAAKNNPLRSYARFYWPIHCQTAESDIALSSKKKERILSFFMQDFDISTAYIDWAEEIASYKDEDILSRNLRLGSQNPLGRRLWSAASSPRSPLKAAYAFGLQILMDVFENLPTSLWRPHLVHADGSRSTTLMHIAAEENDIPRVKRLLKKGVPPDSKDEAGWTPLFYAVGNENEAMMKLLIGTGQVDPNSQDDNQDTPLHHAALGGREAVVKLLLETRGIDPNMRNEEEDTPLHNAASHESEGVVKLFLRTSKVNPDLGGAMEATPLHVAARIGYETTVRLLLKSNRVDPDRKDADEQTPLHCAAERGQITVVKLLLDTGEVDETSKDRWQYTPLHYAARNGHEEVVKLLLESSRVDTKSRDIWKKTPSMLAQERGHEAIVELLEGARWKASARLRRHYLRKST